MEEKIKEALLNPLKELELFVDSVSFGVDEDDKTDTLYITLDNGKEEVIDVETIVKATKIINPKLVDNALI